jgi:hypothetical protein
MWGRELALPISEFESIKILEVTLPEASCASRKSKVVKFDKQIDQLRPHVSVTKSSLRRVNQEFG